ncbi:MAG: 4-hydroxythreonine-4-phosphate dehydrogenase PdxA [Gammaproteobacteria bacterium]|nr:4-hydroxythreonine-4-phosphate dehydrogenase PdxA [Gammaproteobacteria bacterium]
MSAPPVIGVTLGDPAGIGPEVLVKALDSIDRGAMRLVLYGAGWGLARGAEAANATVSFRRWPDVTAIDWSMPEWPLIDVGIEAPMDFRMGEVSAICGDIAVQAVEAAARDALAGRSAAMMTCPISKEAIHAAGYVDDIGHQEILARLAGVEWTATMLMTPGLKVVHLSTHKPLIEAARYVTRANVFEKLRLTHDTLARWGLAAPRIAVAALNPHGGEGGLLGREEIDEIGPAVADARAGGINAAGPIPADSVFNRAIAGEFDVVLALFHDQGHIAVKVHDFHHSVTATLGIPFVRTSVDHGTAFDIAGRGVADPTGAGAALDAAAMLAAGKLS